MTLMPGQILASSDILHPPKDTQLRNRAKGQSQMKTLCYLIKDVSMGVLMYSG